MSSCCLCLNSAKQAPVASWDNPIAESESFVVLPSLGSLVEGWLLLVPKDHYICMGALPDALLQELVAVKSEMAAQIESQYGSLCAFEHGPGEVQRAVGCGVDHAHLHLVPIDFSLLEAARPFLPADATWSAASLNDCRHEYLKGLDYLYFEQPLGSGYISVHRSFGSQVFRKAISMKLGVPEQYSWREHPQLELTSRTIRGLAGGLSLRSSRFTAFAAEK